MSPKSDSAKALASPKARQPLARSIEGSARRQLMENEVLEHATRLFAERGFAGTSLQDIATSMGLKRPALYYYFKSKEELLERLIVEAVSDPARHLKEIADRQDLDAAERLHAITRWNTAWVLNHTDRFLLLVKSESELSPATAARFDASRRKATDVVVGLIQEGVAAGVFRSVDATTAALSVFGISNWAAWWYKPDGRDSIDHVANQIADMTVAGLRRVELPPMSTLSPHAALAVLRADVDRLEQSLDQARSPRAT